MVWTFMGLGNLLMLGTSPEFLAAPVPSQLIAIGSGIAAGLFLWERGRRRTQNPSGFYSRAFSSPIFMAGLTSILMWAAYSIAM